MLHLTDGKGIDKKMKRNNKKPHCIFEYEDEYSLRIRYCVTIKDYIKRMVLSLLPLFLLMCFAFFISDIRKSFSFFCGFVFMVVLYFFIYYRALTNPINTLSYSFVIGKSGIKNCIYKGELYIGWNEFVSSGVLVDVRVRSRNNGYVEKTFVYISNFEFDESRYRQILNKTDHFYRGVNSEKLIAIQVLDIDEARELNTKILEYAKKYASKD